MQVTELRDPDQPLVIRWQGTVWQRRGELLSLFGVGAAAFGFLFLAFRRRKATGLGQPKPTGSTAPIEPRPALFAVGATVICLLVFNVARLAINGSSRGPFLLHSPPGHLAFDVQGEPVVLGDPGGAQVTFLGWEMVRGSSPRTGDPIIVRLYWQPHGKIHERLSGFMHLFTPAIRHSWATGNRGVGRPDSQWWDPSKYYVDELRLVVPPDLPPITYSLIAGMVSSSGERLTVPGSEVDNILFLRELDVRPTRPGLFQNERPEVAARADTDDGLRLQGYDLQTSTGGPNLRLFWETREVPTYDWVTFIHLHNKLGERVAQFDGAALRGLVGTSEWRADALYVDRRQLRLPDALSEGEYLLRIGLFNLTSGERLPLIPRDSSDSFEDGQLIIPTRVLPPEADPNSCYICAGEP